MKQLSLRVMMCALMIALFAAGARADGKLNSVSFKLTPTGNATCISTYNSAVTSGYGTQSGQLVDNKLTISKSFSTTTTSQPVSVTRDPFSPSLTPTGDGPPFFPPSLTPTPVPPRRPTYSTTNSFTLALTGNQTINEGDVFVVGTESTAPSAQVTIAKSTRQLQSLRPPVVTSWTAVSGQVRVVSKSASALTLQLSDVVAQGTSSSDRTTFNGTITATFATSNSAPTDIALSKASVLEKQAVGTTVGTLSATDADAGDTFTYALATGEGDDDNASFAIVDNALKTAEVFDAATKNSYSIRVRVTDAGGATFEKSLAITVTRENHAPSLSNAIFDATANTAFSQQLAGNDADGDALTYRVTAGNLPFGLTLSEQGLLAGTPVIDGSPVATIEVADGNGGTGTAQITIIVKAAVVPPTLAPTLSPASPKTNDTLTVAPNGDAASYAYLWKKNGVVISGESGATLNLAKPGQGDKGDVITCEVKATNAGGAAATATAQVTVANSAPIAISSKGEVAADTEKAFVLNAFDADGDALTYKRVGGPRNGVIADIRVDPTDGKTKLFYKSRPFYGGVDIIRFVVFDSSNKQSNESTLGINVLYTPPPANRAPIAGDTNIDTYVGKSEVKGLLGSDPDGDAITFRIVGNAKYGKSEIKQDTDGVYKLFYTSLNRFYGDDRVTYIVTDSRGKESNLATVSIHFINRAPLAQGNRIGVAAGAPVAQYLFGTDEDGDALSFRLVNNPRYGKGEIKRDPQGKWRFYYQSLPGYAGPDQITFIAVDAFGKESQVATIDINVVKTLSTSSALQAGAAPSGGNS